MSGIDGQIREEKTRDSACNTKRNTRNTHIPQEVNGGNPLQINNGHCRRFRLPEEIPKVDSGRDEYQTDVPRGDEGRRKKTRWITEMLAKFAGVPTTRRGYHVGTGGSTTAGEG